MVTWKYVPLARDAGYYQLYVNGEFHHTCDVGELSRDVQKLNTLLNL